MKGGFAAGYICPIVPRRLWGHSSKIDAPSIARAGRISPFRYD